MLFGQLNKFPLNGAEEKDLILIMSRLLRKDINTTVTNFSPDEAVKIPESVDEK